MGESKIRRVVLEFWAQGMKFVIVVTVTEHLELWNLHYLINKFYLLVEVSIMKQGHCTPLGTVSAGSRNLMQASAENTRSSLKNQNTNSWRLD